MSAEETERLSPRRYFTDCWGGLCTTLGSMCRACVEVSEETEMPSTPMERAREAAHVCAQNPTTTDDDMADAAVTALLSDEEAMVRGIAMDIWAYTGSEDACRKCGPYEPCTACWKITYFPAATEVFRNLKAHLLGEP